MNWIEFIKKNVEQQLSKDGFSAAICVKGADVAVNHYKATAQFSGKGKAFDDCYKKAKDWAVKNSTAADKRDLKK